MTTELCMGKVLALLLLVILAGLVCREFVTAVDKQSLPSVPDGVNRGEVMGRQQSAMR